jgi:hypothetical protein
MRLGTLVLGLVLPLLFIVLIASGTSLVSATPVHARAGVVHALISTDSSSQAVTCPSGSSIILGPVNLTCFQSLDLAEVGAIIIGVAIAIYIYWDSDRAELPGEDAEIPVTAEEEVARQKKRREEP